MENFQSRKCFYARQIVTHGMLISLTNNGPSGLQPVLEQPIRFHEIEVGLVVNGCPAHFVEPNAGGFASCSVEPVARGGTLAPPFSFCPPPRKRKSRRSWPRSMNYSPVCIIKWQAQAAMGPRIVPIRSPSPGRRALQSSGASRSFPASRVETSRGSGKGQV